MATIDELVIQLSADTKELQAEMRAATQIMAKSSSDMAKSMEDFSKKASKDAGFFQNALSTMAGYISGEAVIGAFKSLKDAMVGAIEDGIQGAIEGQNAFVAFSQALVTTGKYSETSANQFRMFADEIQNTTGISAEAALGVGKLLSSFTNLDISQMETATKAIADFATLTGVDMDMAARMFAKAMDGQSEAFKKYNVQIKEGATESETFKNIVDALNSKSMGAAAAQANTYSGALKILKMSWGEVTEEIGKGLVENKVVINLFREIGRMFLDMSDGVKKDSGGMKDSVAELIKLFFGFGSAVIDVVQLVMPLFKTIGYGLQAMADAAAQGIILIRDGWDAASKFGADASKRLEDQWASVGEKSKVLEEAQSRFEYLIESSKQAQKEVVAGDQVTEEAFQKTNATIDSHIVKLTAAQEAAKAWAQSLAESANSTEEIFAIENGLLKAQFDAKLMTEQEYMDAHEALVMANIENDRAMLEESAAQGLIKDQELAQARYALEMKSQQDQLALKAARMKSEEQLEKTREQNFKSTLGTISSLAGSSNKELAAIGKAAAVTQATIDGYAAVQKALASAPPPFNFALAAAVGVATAGNVAKILGTPLASGIDSVPGTGFKDNFPAVLAPGERVVPKKTNEDLTAALEGGGLSGTQIQVTVHMNDIFTSDPREMGLKIIETINEAAQANGIQVLGNQIR